MPTGISVKLPLAYDEEDGPYRLTKTLKETVAQNFKNLVLTSPGERVMLPEFGVGVYGLLFENATEEVKSTFAERLYQQTKEHLPFISIINLESNFIENMWVIQIEYFIDTLGVGDALNLNLSMNDAGLTRLAATTT